MSRRIEKQNAQSTGTPVRVSSTQCVCTLCVVFSNACVANCSQYSTADWFSNSCAPHQRRPQNTARRTS